MPRPLTVHPFTSFLGTVDDINNVILPEVYSPRDSLNLYVDKMGRLKKIPGWSYLNDTPIVLDSNSQDSRGFGIFEYSTDALGAGVAGPDTGTLLIQVQGVSANTEVWASTDGGATWTYLTNSLLATAGRVYDFSQYKNIVYWSRGAVTTSGGTAVQTYNGTTVSSAGLTQSPTPSSSADSGGANLKGNYKWKLVSMVGDQRQQGSAASTVLSLDGEQADISWSADSNTNVTGYELYRTTGTGELFYFVTAISGRTTTSYTDNTADRVILANRALQEYGDPPPAGAWWLEIHKDRAWYGAAGNNDGSFPERLWYSDPGRPWSVGPLNYVDITDSEGVVEALSGMTGGFEGQLVVWKPSGIWLISGTGAVINGVPDLYVRKSSATIGSIGHRTVTKIPAGAVFRDAKGTLHQTDKPTLAFMSPLGDIRIFDGNTDTIVSADLPNVPTTGSGVRYRYAHCVHDHKRGMVIWWPPGTAVSVANSPNLMVWDYRHGTWHQWDQYKEIGAAIEIVSGESTQIIGVTGSASGDRAGKVMKLFDESTETDPDGNAFTARWASNTFYGFIGEDTAGIETNQPAMHLTKRWRWVQLLMNSGSDVEVQLDVLRGNQAASETPYTTKILDLSASPSRYSTIEKVQILDSDGQFMHDQGIRLVVEDRTSPNDQWILEGLILAYNPLEGTKRDSGRPGT